MPNVSFRFCTEKVTGAGEDADPILRVGPDLGLVGVFDGMGGAGGTVYDTADGRRTGAYLASRVARDVVERRMLELMRPEWHLDGPAAAAELHATIDTALKARLAELKAPPSALRSKLVRALPTTVAVAAIQRTSGASFACHAFWAGDSRVYAVEPAGGMRQLTTDDLRSGADAMRNLTNDSVMSNCASADTDFRVNHRKVELTAPFLLVAATDGCFGYVHSPMHFEHLLLGTLQDARDADGWRVAITSAVASVTGDDAALVLLGVGADLAGFKRLFRDRAATVARTFVEPLDVLDGDVARAERELAALRAHRDERRIALWDQYRGGYERYLTVTAATGEERP